MRIFRRGNARATKPDSDIRNRVRRALPASRGAGHSPPCRNSGRWQPGGLKPSGTRQRDEFQGARYCHKRGRRHRSLCFARGRTWSDRWLCARLRRPHFDFPGRLAARCLPHDRRRGTRAVPGWQPGHTGKAAADQRFKRTARNIIFGLAAGRHRDALAEPRTRNRGEYGPAVERNQYRSALVRDLHRHRRPAGQCLRGTQHPHGNKRASC